MIIFLYIIVVAIINFSGHADEVVKSWNDGLGTHMDGFSMFIIYLGFILVYQGIQDIISKLNDLEKKIDKR